MSRWYAWKPDLPDRRDHASELPARRLPVSSDLRKSGFMPPVIDQGNLGSCVACAVGAAYEFADRSIGTDEVYRPSRLFLYYNGRRLEDTVGEDSGLYIRDGIKSAAKWGAPPERFWPYKVRDFTRRPPKSVYDAARPGRIREYARVEQDLRQFKAHLTVGLPVVFGFSVYESFESEIVARTGTVPMPRRGERLLGGHAVLLCGHDDRAGRFGCRNSWGGRWGRRGYFTLPYDYVLDRDLADDFWTIFLAP